MHKFNRQTKHFPTIGLQLENPNCRHNATQINKHTGTEPTELLPLPIAQSMETFQGQDQNANGQLPIRILLLTDDPPDGDQSVETEEESGQGSLYQCHAGHNGAI